MQIRRLLIEFGRSRGENPTPSVSTPVSHGAVPEGLSPSPGSTREIAEEVVQHMLQALEKSGICHALTPVDLKSQPTSNNTAKSGPDTQVD